MTPPLVNGILDFKDHWPKLWAACALDDETLVERLLNIHRFYHEDLRLDHPRLRDAPNGLFWVGLDVLRIIALLGLSDTLETRLGDAELFDATNLHQESPIHFLDEDDFRDVLADVGPATEVALFTLAVFYLKTSSRSCSRKA